MMKILLQFIKNRILFPCFLVLLFSMLHSVQAYSTDLDIYGYYEPQYQGFYINDQYIHLNSNKLRVDLRSQPVESVELKANFNSILYFGQTTWNILDYLPSSLTSSLSNELAANFAFDFENQYYLDNVYAKFKTEYIDVTIGKQQIAFGSGYAWNPIDTFNQKDVMDPTYEKAGVNAIRLEGNIGTRFSYDLMVSPAEDLTDSGKLARAKIFLGSFDFSAMYVEQAWTYTDYSTFTETSYLRRLIGGDLSGELLGVGMHAEGGYSILVDGDNFWEVLGGLDYTFDFETMIMIEYYHNSQGKTSSADYTLTDWMQYYAQEKKTIAQDQIYFYLSHPLSDFIEAGLSVISCINDASFMVVPMFTYSMLENVDLSMFIGANIGETGDFYGSSAGQGGFVRAKVYF
ncbi:MAG: hypothetical protein ABIA04_00680 [Pseudomonadota bacterium]